MTAMRIAVERAVFAGPQNCASVVVCLRTPRRPFLDEAARFLSIVFGRRLGTLLQRVLAVAIYCTLENRAERQGMSPEAGIAGQPGAKLMKFRPLHDRVVVRRIEGEEKTKGGIIIPDTVKEKPQEGEVIAVGPGARDEGGKLVAIDLKAGDRVLFGKWSGTEVKIDGEDLLIMKESDVMGVIEGASATKKKAA
jgi:chaperonin GroES